VVSQGLQLEGGGGTPASTTIATAEMVRKPLTTLMATVLCNLLTNCTLRRPSISSLAHIALSYALPRSARPAEAANVLRRSFAVASTEDARRSRCASKIQWLSRVRPRYFIRVPIPTSAPPNLNFSSFGHAP
jgi:hypothetical protein